MTVKNDQNDLSKGDLESIEQRPDADARFRAAVQAAARSGPKHRPAKEGKR